MKGEITAFFFKSSKCTRNTLISISSQASPPTLCHILQTKVTEQTKNRVLLRPNSCSCRIPKTPLWILRFLFAIVIELDFHSDPCWCRRKKHICKMVCMHRPTVHNLRPYVRMRPSIMKFAAVYM